MSEQSRIKLDKLPSEDDFIITYHDFYGRRLTFIRPNVIGTKWTKDNLIFRSSVWDDSGYLVSGGFKKFFNLNEAPDIDPWDENLTASKVVTKLDGSLLILSIVNSKPMIRTRGSIDCLQMKNFYELEKLIPKHFGKDYIWDEYSSYLYEWQSPAQQIVIKHKKPHLSLIGQIKHWDYSYANQRSLDCHCELHGGSRPAYWDFKNKEDMLSKIATWENLEGACLYYNNDQSIRKIKGLWYLKLHAFKSECSIKTLIYLYIERGCPNKEKFKKHIETQFDYECLVMAEPYIDRLYAEIAKLHSQLADVGHEVAKRTELCQKNFANWLIEYTKKDKILSGYGFLIRKGGELSSETMQKILLQRLNNDELKG